MGIGKSHTNTAVIKKRVWKEKSAAMRSNAGYHLAMKGNRPTVSPNCETVSGFVEKRVQWRFDFQSGSRVLNLFLCISGLECSDAEQYWISLGNERQSAPQCHLHIIFLTMIRLVEWS